MAKEEKEQSQTIETITKSYEEKIAEREKQVLQEKEAIKREMTEKFEKEKAELQQQHNKDITDLIMGRKEYQEIQNKEKQKEENDSKSFFDRAVEETKRRLGITKEEKK